MKRKILTLSALVCALFCALGLIACGNTGGDSDGGDNKDHEDKEPIIAVERIEFESYAVSYAIGSYQPDGFYITATVFPKNATNVVVEWSSNNNGIATVTSNGLAGWVEPKEAGDVVITAKVGDVQAKCEVHITKPTINHSVDKITFAKENVYLKVGDEETLAYDILPVEAKDNAVTWEITDGQDVITCDDGNITAIADGQATVWVRSGDRSTYCHVYVNSGTAGLRFDIRPDSAAVYTFIDDFVGELIIPSTYKGLPVTAIKNSAFKDKSGITSASIPSSVTTIENSAFENCSGLQSVTIPATTVGTGAFSGCSSLQSVTITSDLESTSGGTFQGCTSLKNVTYASGVTSVNLSILDFGGERPSEQELTITIPDSVTEVVGSTYNDNIAFNVHNGVRYLGNEGNPYIVVYKALFDQTFAADLIHPNAKIICARSFYNYNEVAFDFTELVIPDGVTYLGYSAFRSSAITSLSIPKSLITIVPNAFYFNNLEEITVDADNPNFATVDGVLYDKDKSTLVKVPQNYDRTLTIPATANKVDTGAFDNAAITSIVVDESNPVYSSQSGILYDKAKTQFVKIPSKLGGDIVIPSGITTITSNLFRNKALITSIVIPDSVTSIESGAFSGCSGLQKMTVPFVGGSLDAQYYPSSGDADRASAHFGYIFGARVVVSSNSDGLPNNRDHVPASLKEVTITKAIGTQSYAFYGCNNIEKITFTGDDKSSGETIGRSSFTECSSLKTLILAHGVSTIRAGAFDSCGSLTAVVLSGSVTTVEGYAEASARNVVFYYTGSTWNTSFPDVTHYVNTEWEYVDGVPTVRR